jgi:uncharacterized protein YndB with AHSA1/START domain
MNPEPTTIDREIVLNRVIDAPRERVWAAWADPIQLAGWWGPNGFTTTTHEFSLAPGGVWSFIMHGPDGTDYPNRIEFRDVERPARLAYAHGGEGGVNFEVTVAFEERDGQTEITMRSIFPTPEARNHVVEKYGAIEGGQQTLARLAGYVANQPAFEVNLERLIDASRERVWAAWADPEQIVHWFAPRPYTLRVDRMDFRSGGGFEMAMRAPDGSEHAFSGKYVELVRPARLVWTGEFADGPPEQIRTEVLFLSEAGKTRVKVRQSFSVVTPQTEPATRGARQGWTMTLTQLDEFVVGK